MDPTTPGFMSRGTYNVEDAAVSSVPNHPRIGKKVFVKQLIKIANCKLHLSEKQTDQVDKPSIMVMKSNLQVCTALDLSSILLQTEGATYKNSPLR